MRLQREKERGEGSKEVSDLLTVYTRVREFPLLHKSFRSGKADTTYPFSLTQSSLFCPPPPLVQPAILPSSAVASLRSIHPRCFYCRYCCVGVLHVVYPFARGFTFVWRWKWMEPRLVETAASFNWDAEPQLQCVCVRVYVCASLYLWRRRMSKWHSWRMLLRFVNIEIFFKKIASW